jgi:hypothetical protein
VVDSATAAALESNPLDTSVEQSGRQKPGSIPAQQLAKQIQPASQSSLVEHVGVLPQVLNWCEQQAKSPSIVVRQKHGCPLLA